MFPHSNVWYAFNGGHFCNVWNALLTVSSAGARQLVVHILFFLTYDCFKLTFAYNNVRRKPFSLSTFSKLQKKHFKVVAQEITHLEYFSY